MRSGFLKNRNGKSKWNSVFRIEAPEPGWGAKTFKDFSVDKQKVMKDFFFNDVEINIVVLKSQVRRPWLVPIINWLAKFV